VPKVTTQIINVVVSEKGALVLLPDPVTCFRSASYKQVQTFHLSRGASLVVLDWVTSGRIALGEEWVFSRYHSANNVWVDGKLIAKDVMLLEEQEEIDTRSLPRRTLFDKLSPYSCYASLILHGPMVENTIREISEQYDSITVFNTIVKPALIWSLSPISDGKGCVVRVAGKESECVKGWLGNALRGLQDAIGVDVFRRAFT
jgi:urease accessory protein